jgi:hypothetical protein
MNEVNWMRELWLDLGLPREQTVDLVTKTFKNSRGSGAFEQIPTRDNKMSCTNPSFMRTASEIT